MRFEINKCKNHLYISEGVPGNVDGFRVYGLEFAGIKYLFTLPKLLWHQVVCPDNPALHQLSNWIEKTYKPLSYKEQLKLKRQEQLVITEKKTETII